MITTEFPAEIFNGCSLSRILPLFQPLLAILSWAGHLHGKLLATWLKYPLVFLICTYSSGCFQKQFKYKILKIQ